MGQRLRNRISLFVAELRFFAYSILYKNTRMQMYGAKESGDWKYKIFLNTPGKEHILYKNF